MQESFQDKIDYNNNNRKDWQYHYIFDGGDWHFFIPEKRDISEYYECDSSSLKKEFMFQLNHHFEGDNYKSIVLDHWHFENSTSWASMQIYVNRKEYDLDDIYQSFQSAVDSWGFVLAVKYSDVYGPMDSELGGFSDYFEIEFYREKPKERIVEPKNVWEVKFTD